MSGFSRSRTRSRGLVANLLWLAVLLALVGAAALTFRGGGGLFVPSRETAVVRVFQQASPAVVNIVAQPLPESPELGISSRPRSAWARDYYRRFHGGPAEQELNLGSGIIIAPEGYILTNEHVVLHTAWIQVNLADGRTARGEVWGTEPSLDLAVIKINLEGPLPYLEPGRSGDLMIGEQVIVIGNPFQLGHTCTTGVVSALHRSVRAGDRIYRDLIQIDAAVNPGNSGGPLLNIRGELVGITTAIDARAEGIGFAIPIEMATGVMEDLIQYRYVPTGWLGVSVEELGRRPEDFGVETGGVFVSWVDEGSPSAGRLKPGDILELWNGEPAPGVEDFVRRVRGLRVDETVKLRVFREGSSREVAVRARVFPEELAEEWAWWHLGLRLREVPPHSPERRLGRLVVEGVAPNSPAYNMGLAPGDVMDSINRERIRSLDDFRKAVVRLRSRENIFIRVRRGNFILFATIPIRMSGEKW